MKYSTLFFSAAIAVTAVACNESDSGSAVSDNLTREEGEIMDNSAFKNAFTKSIYFEKWDQNNDGKVDEHEFYRNYVRTMDEDQDGQIKAAEWERGMGAYYRGFDQKPKGRFEEITSESNGQLSTQEAESKLREMNYIKEWNTDGEEGLIEEELAKGVFHNLDEDGDGIVEAEKYSDYFKKYQGS